LEEATLSPPDAGVDSVASDHATPAGSKSGRSGLAAADRRFGAMLALPATIILLLLIGAPSIQTVIYSLQKVSFNGPSTFVGLDNYIRLAGSSEFQTSFRITTLFASGFVVISTALGLGFAILLNQRFPGRGIARTLLILPWAAPWLVVGIMWKWFIDADVGMLNGFLYQFGMTTDYIPFLAKPDVALFFTIVAASWRQASLSGLLFLAALQTIPPDLPEAGRVDGASTWQSFRYITLPWLRPVMMVVVVTNVIFGFLQFDVIYAMTQGGPGNSTTLLSMLLYKQIFQFSNVGVGSAIAVTLGLVAFGVGLVFVKFLYRSETVYGHSAR
jgi:ABC-type sugar transport system permease subunit